LSGQVDTRKPRSFYDGKIVGSFKEADLAVLKIDAGELPYLLFSEPETLKQGQLVAALGNPEGLRDSLSLGVISSVSQQIEPDDSMAYIQTDAALAPGNSGGPLVDVQGGIVGINVFSVTDRGKDERLGFAVPGEMVRLVYEQIRQYGCVPRANLGVDLQGVTPTLASALHLPADSGVIVSSVPPGTPASKSLQTGDVILSFAGTHVESLPQLNWALLHRRAGQHVPLEVSRNHTKTALKLVLVGGTPDSVDDLAATDIEENSLDKLGVVGSSFKRGANEPHSKEAPSGVLVTARLSGTDAQPELEVGDVIRSLNGISITSVAPLRAMVDSFKPGDAVALQIERKGRLMYVAFEID
jgi:serine protease Do